MTHVIREQLYVEQASELEDGESLFIPVGTKKEQQRTHTLCCKFAREFTSWVDTEITLVVKKTFRDGKLWIKITKDKAPTEVYVLGADNKTVKAVKPGGE